LFNIDKLKETFVKEALTVHIYNISILITLFW